MSELTEAERKELLCDCADEANPLTCPGCTGSALHLWTEKSGAEILEAAEAIVARHVARAAREALLSAAGAVAHQVRRFEVGCEADTGYYDAHMEITKMLRDRADQIG